ncbi:MAG: M48 family metallopeptidase [Deltaproteobacteria bacterium]|nr:M48 family metallopeptidase [Deltaproteobacteria bacterium]
MNRTGIPGRFLLLMALLWLASCTTVPITGRSQFNIVSDASITSLSLQQYQEFLGQAKVSSDPARTAAVKKVGNRIRGAVEQYLTQNGMAEQIQGYQWEFNLVEDQQINAWAMPGGKVVVYSGLLPIVEDEAGLAVVIGHEVAHVIARHGNERMSQELMRQMGGIALSTALATQPGATRELGMQVFGLGSQLGVMLPFSRLHEEEADRLGLIFMAMAGYDPQKAVVVWQRMAAQKGASTPEFLSTHPSDATRIRNIQAFIPEARRYFRPAVIY